ncbi:hypothetical protein AYJ57_21835 (plasmid) [Salipiger sp. CCB-MM3]|uniref:SHOCT domain-containing protein n=1 Tax=Salipiger sp. CCB-MM3 TaxID=1792508 RepID=UPI00080AA9E8|nr:SHOCT domain-containing protein [Salipiger sp. CCB-MM3]ANT63113.1 hypothetical protein AYJ57_21835 [Salipiger sp. CCB-MM3]
MPRLTDEGEAVVADIAARHGISGDAALHMLMAVSAGHGTQAQFNHPELGGMGQWSQGGMTMVGDMFNNGLKARVDALCTDLSGIVQQHSLFAAPVSSQSQSQGGMHDLSGVSLFVQETSDWPADLGQPTSVGTQNDLRYAYFADKRRLAIKIGGRTTIYDTGNHQFGGFGQAQGAGQSLSFTSQHGLVHLSDLPIVNGTSPGSQDSAPQSPEAAPVEVTQAPKPQTEQEPRTAPSLEASRDMTDDQIFSRIERLAGLFEKGILTKEEFEAKKAELLARL